MRVLVVAPWVPNTRRPRSLQICSMLAEEHDVQYVVAAWSRAEKDDAQRLPGSRVRVVSLSRAWAAVRALFALGKRRVSLQQAFVDDKRFRRELVAAEREFQPDLVLFNVIRSAQFVTSLTTATRRVIDLDEFRSRYYEQVARASDSRFQRTIGRIEAPRMRAVERDALDRFDAVLVSSPDDMSPNDDRIRLVRSAHLIAPDMASVPERGRERAKSVLFVGRMSYLANVEAVSWYAREVLPKALLHEPGLTLNIVGDSPSPAVLRLAGQNVNVTGRVDDLDSWYAAAGVVIVPIRMATGVQMKLIEGLAAGRPVVVTPRVARLAGVSHGRQVLIADDAEDWVDATVAAVRSEADHLVSTGRRWVEDHHGADAVRAQLMSALDPLRDRG